MPVHYPVACSPQGWSAASIPFMLQSLLGLEPEAFEHRLRIVRPTLPTFVNMIELRGPRVAAPRPTALQADEQGRHGQHAPDARGVEHRGRAVDVRPDSPVTSPKVIAAGENPRRAYRTRIAMARMVLRLELDRRTGGGNHQHPATATEFDRPVVQIDPDDRVGT